ncbi:MAG TPA: hypothetical protein VKX16_18740 [Chloroflexota bacterium]|nr:hypothetical protein [Chloroflexota bacterium]
MIKPIYNRQSRTFSSEQYQLMDGDTQLGHLDLHFGAHEVFGTLVLDRELSEEQSTQLIEQIDEDLVLSAEVPREDFLCRVYVGREVGLFSDELLQDELVIDGHEDFDDES